MSEPETNRPMPAEQAIHWKPLRAAHYIMASLQSADGGRRTLVVRQEVLARAQRFAAAAHARRVQGSCSQSSPARLGILEADLHYNLHVDEADVLSTPFPEHWDLDRRTVYVKETCVNALRAKCRQLRQTESLEREWKVSPTIHLLTPGDWRAVARDRSDRRGEAGAIRALNAQRTAELPERVRRQFRLTP